MGIKVATFLLVASFVLWIFFWLPTRIKKTAGARFRYIVFTIAALVFAAFMMKKFL